MLRRQHRTELKTPSNRGSRPSSHVSPQTAVGKQEEKGKKDIGKKFVASHFKELNGNSFWATVCNHCSDWYEHTEHPLASSMAELGACSWSSFYAWNQKALDVWRGNTPATSDRHCWRTEATSLMNCCQKTGQLSAKSTACLNDTCEVKTSHVHRQLN